MTSTPLAHRLVAELGGTFVLVLFGCGSAIMAATAADPDGIQVGIGYLGVALAFGLAVFAAVSATAGVSGGHLNPAVTVGLAVAGRVEAKAVLPYVLAQIVGASAAGGVLYAIASGRSGFDPVKTGFASNGFGTRSPGGFDLASVFVAELVLTAVFVAVILAVTRADGPTTLAPLAIGLTLTAIHLVAIPISNTSVNPARSLGVAWFAGSAALSQVWVFLVAPIVGAVVAGVLDRMIDRSRSTTDRGADRPLVNA